MITLEILKKSKVNRRPLTMVTCYDYAWARILDGTTVDLVLVGDSVAMTTFGFATTLHADVDMLVESTSAVARGCKQKAIIADMPFPTFRLGITEAVRVADRLMKAGAQGVKIEGLLGHEDVIQHLVQSGVPVTGHLGLTPQFVHTLGGFKVQGQDPETAEAILEQAKKLEGLGVNALVLECVPEALAAQITKSLSIPTVGIGAGIHCDGQVLVLHDLLGIQSEFKPKFVRGYANLKDVAQKALENFAEDVRHGRFPSPEESYGTRKLPLKESETVTIPLVSTVSELQTKLAPCWQNRESIGFVPTMGALHEGHAALVKASARQNTFTVASIFVNPTQFNSGDDLKNYPRTLEKDLALLKLAGADLVFTPKYETLYPDNYRYKVTEDHLSRTLCGEHRPGHFDGVLTVVTKLLNLVRPQRAYFGEKDYQQLQLIKDLVANLFLPVDVIAVPTVREHDGLAMSSRNQRLSAAERKVAPRLFSIISTAKTSTAAALALESEGFKVDYVQDLRGRRFAAAHLGQVRLIDNVLLETHTQPNAEVFP